MNMTGIKRTREQSACADGAVASSRPRPFTNIATTRGMAHAFRSIISSACVREGPDASSSNTRRRYGGAPRVAKKSKVDTSGIKTFEGVGLVSQLGKERRAVQTRAVTSRWSFALVCASNVNRSMMAHGVLQAHNIKARSFGVGSMVRLPSKEARNPRCFDFGTPYAKMRKDLAMEDEAFYRGNRVLDLLKRNEAIKAAPQQWQRLSDADVASFDVVVCFEDRVFKKVLEDIRERGEPSGLYKPVHLILMTVKDSAEESEASSSDVLRLCKTLDALENLIMDAHKSVRRLSAETPRDLQHRIVHV